MRVRGVARPGCWARRAVPEFTYRFTYAKKVKRNYLFLLVGGTGFEPVTPAV